MSLSNFFRINLPYGFERNAAGEWAAFNRDYVPIGFSDERYPRHSTELPIYAPYPGLTESLIESLVDDKASIGRDPSGNIERFFLYGDRTNPTDPRDTEERNELYAFYFNKLKIISERNCEAISRPLHK